MAILSITFHSEEHITSKWEQYLKNEIIPQINTWQKKTILSEVETEMLYEGKNTNLLIFFDNPSDRIYFIENTFPSFTEKIINNFSDKVLIFKTLLNTIN